jgi:ABC-type bacteriocin/lantibiotic exporter with double-glycine peptidase domain
VFYVYLILGFLVFGVGLVITPGSWKLAWIAVAFSILAFLPLLLSKLFDPLNAKRIRSNCERAGVTDIEIQAFPNHYGVHFKKNDKKHYAKCKIVRGSIEWKGVSPRDA